MRIVFVIGAFLSCVAAAGCQKPAGTAPAPTAQTEGVRPSASAANPTNADDARTRLLSCCKQCSDAASRDPAGNDLTVVPCTKYRGTWNGNPGVDEKCAALFQEQNTLVGSCWALTK